MGIGYNRLKKAATPYTQNVSINDEFKIIPVFIVFNFLFAVVLFIVTLNNLLNSFEIRFWFEVKSLFKLTAIENIISIILIQHFH